jgi:hypothetical protein
MDSDGHREDTCAACATSRYTKDVGAAQCFTCADIGGLYISQQCVPLSTFLSSTIVPAFFIGAVVIAAWLYYRQEQLQNVYLIDEKEIVFGTAPPILGRGTFGQVLKAEYRGTSVAVKRVLPMGSQWSDMGSNRLTRCCDDGSSELASDESGAHLVFCPYDPESGHAKRQAALNALLDDDGGGLFGRNMSGGMMSISSASDRPQRTPSSIVGSGLSALKEWVFHKSAQGGRGGDRACEDKGRNPAPQ